MATMLPRSVLRTSRQVARSAYRVQPTFSPSPVASTRAFAPSRRYSETPVANTQPEEEAGNIKAEKPVDEAAQAKEQAEKKDREIIDLKDKYLRSVAEFRNLQDRTKREIQSARDFALQRFAKDLVESVDNLDRALATTPPEKLTSENSDLVTLHDGLKMTESILMSTLKKHGLERFDPSEKEENFDPNIHEAVFMTPQKDKEDGICFHTQQKGFFLNGRILRAAKVGVVKNS